jgi:uncharacterized RDD family membrane protein YckC
MCRSNSANCGAGVPSAAKGNAGETPALHRRNRFPDPVSWTDRCGGRPMLEQEKLAPTNKVLRIALRMGAHVGYDPQICPAQRKNSRENCVFIPMPHVSSRPDTAMSIAPAKARSHSEPLDCVVRVVTPERITLVLPLAGPARRFVAYLLDQMLLLALVLAAIALVLIASMGSRAGWGLILVAYFVLSWSYGAFCEGVFDGQTFGKYALGIRVVSENGVAITGAQAVLRNLVGVVDGLVPFCFLVGLTSAIVSRRFQRVGDLAAGTIVMIEERPTSRPIARVKSPEVDALLEWLPRRVAAGPKLARVVSDYADQRRRFTPPRRAEMAEHLARPLRARYAIRGNVPADVVLCAFYHRLFLGD